MTAFGGRGFFLALAVAFPTACLSTPPDYQPPELGAPIIENLSPHPSIIHDVLPNVSGGYDFEVSFSLASEEPGEVLNAKTFIDLLPSDNRGAAFDKLAVTNGYDFNSESIRSAIEVTSTGCHTLTLILTWEGNVDDAHFPLPISAEESVEITWWLNLNPDPSEEFQSPSLDGCPGGDRSGS